MELNHNTICLLGCWLLEVVLPGQEKCFLLSGGMIRRLGKLHADSPGACKR
jgi:hypothetical protein